MIHFLEAKILASDLLDFVMVFSLIYSPETPLGLNLLRKLAGAGMTDGLRESSLLVTIRRIKYYFERELRDVHGSSEQMMMAAMSGLGLQDSSMASGHGGL
ncbi:hypothetical protein E2542_SST00137 [Spatholobus suberectus]|nr:hypothetical protein E2542_SST00137 [Spatholobus suberectus]